MRRDLAREAEIVRMFRDGALLRVIGATFGIGSERVRQLVAQAGELPRLSDEHLIEVADLYRNGKTVEAIAQDLECSRDRVIRYMDRIGLKRRRPGPQKRERAGLIQPTGVGGSEHARPATGLGRHCVSAGPQQHHQHT